MGLPQSDDFEQYTQTYEIMKVAVLFPDSKFFRPVNFRGHLHDDKQRDNRANGDGQASEAFKEKGIRKADKIYQLRERAFEKRKTTACDQAHIRQDEKNRNRRTDGKRKMNGDVVNQISEQQMKGEEGGG